MALTAETLPDSIRRVLPAPALTVFVSAARSALFNGADEGRAMATAWAAVRRAGYSRGEDGVWARKVEKSHMDTLYVSRKLLNADALMRWAEREKLPGTLAPADSLHVTIAYSRALVDWDAIGDSYSKTVAVDGGARYMTLLGQPETTLVLVFVSGTLRWRHEELKDLGASWDWPEYRPHVSLSHDVTEGFDMTGVRPYLGPLEFGPEIMSPINENWRDTLKSTTYGVWWSNRSAPSIVTAASGIDARTEALAKKRDAYGVITAVRRL